MSIKPKFCSWMYSIENIYVKSLFKLSSFSHLFVMTYLQDNDLCSIKTNQPSSSSHKKSNTKKSWRVHEVPKLHEDFFILTRRHNFTFPFTWTYITTAGPNIRNKILYHPPFLFNPIAINYLTSFSFLC